MNLHFFTAPFYFAFIWFRVQGSGFRVQGSRGGFAAFFAEGAAGAGRKGEISAACRTLP